MKDERKSLAYSWVGNVLKVTDSDTGDAESFDFSEVPEELDTQFLKLGRRTKLGNFSADAVKLGRSKLPMMRDGFAQLRDGDWAAEREKLPGWLKGRTAEIRAIAELQGADEEDVKATLAKLSEAQGLKVLGNEKVQKKAEEFRKATKSRKTIDLSTFA